MRARRALPRRGAVGFGTAVLAGSLFASVGVAAMVDETGDKPPLARGDRLWPTSDDIQARIQRGFAFFGPMTVERRDEAASDNGRARVETVPTPPPSVVMVAPEDVAPPTFEPETRFEPPTAYAPPVAPPVAAIDKATGRAIAAPLPRRRPAVPVAVAPAPGEEASPVRLAALEPMPVPAPRSAARDAAIEAPIAADFAVIGEPKRIPKEALPYLAILRREAAANKVPLWLAVGVGWVESKYNPKLRGTHGVVGLMQVMPATARFQGYKGTPEQLLDAETNIVWGMRELGWDWAKSGGNACLAVAKYKGGILTKTIPSAAASYCEAAKRVTGML
jgi:soluble lytic murein transglycosylase-like protein